MIRRFLIPSTPWLLLFGLLNLFSSGRWTLAAAAWLAPLFALRFLATTPGRRRFLWFYLVTWLTLSISWYGATPIWGAAHFIFMAVNAVMAILPFAVDRWLAPRLSRDGRLSFSATFVLPLAATALEFLTIDANPLGNFGATGNSQAGFPIAVQLVSVTGLLGLTFLINWTASAVHWGWEQRFAWPRIRRGALALGAVLAAVFALGAGRLLAAPAPDAVETVPVATFTVQPVDMAALAPLAEQDPDAFRAETRAVHAAYLQETAAAAAGGARIVLWPELAGLGVEEDVQALLAEGRALAAQAGIYLAMPTLTVFPGQERPGENVLTIADPRGEIVLTHVKFGGAFIEGTLAGSGELQAVETPYGTLSGVICWDTDFPAIVRQAGRQGVDILLSPAKEWAAIDPMHASMAVFRGVENGLTVVRQSDGGRSMISDPYGRILAAAPWTGQSAMRAGVPVVGVATLYPVAGDFVGFVSVAGLLVVGIRALVAGRRKQAAAPQPVHPAG